jgi:hypothetical protein
MVSRSTFIRRRPPFRNCDRPEWREWDWPNEPKRSRRPRIETVQVLPPRPPQPERCINVNVHSNSHVPQLILAGALLFLALRFLPYLGIGLLIVLALLIAHPFIGIVQVSSLRFWRLPHFVTTFVAIPSDVGVAIRSNEPFVD